MIASDNGVEHAGQRLSGIGVPAVAERVFQV
jgi:hypothetical protein